MFLYTQDETVLKIEDSAIRYAEVMMLRILDLKPAQVLISNDCNYLVLAKFFDLEENVEEGDRREKQMLVVEDQIRTYYCTDIDGGYIKLTFDDSGEGRIYFHYQKDSGYFNSEFEIGIVELEIGKVVNQQIQWHTAHPVQFFTEGLAMVNQP